MKTDGTRPTCARRSNSTSGASTKLRRIASARGSSISRAKYNAATVIATTIAAPAPGGLLACKRPAVQSLGVKG